MLKSKLLFERIINVTCITRNLRFEREIFRIHFKYVSSRSAVDFQWFLHGSSFHQTLANNNLIHVSINESDIQQLNYPIMGKKNFLTL